MYSAQTENKHITNAFFMPAKPLATALGPTKGRATPRSDVSMRALIQVGEILNICFKCDLINDSNLTIIKLGTGILNVLC
jgi:hypothetical protein